MTVNQAVGLIRVSTSEQGKSGLGLATQKAAIRSFASAESFDIVQVVEEVASGKLGLADREGLRSALAKAKKPFDISPDMNATSRLSLSSLDTMTGQRSPLLNGL